MSSNLAVPATAIVLQHDSRHLPFADNTIDLVVTSPPYFALRSYQDAGEHYEGQVGAEATPAEFIDSLIEVTAECVRVLKPTGSLFVNLGDKYAERGGPARDGGVDGGQVKHRAARPRRLGPPDTGIRAKSLMGLPWRYALRCIDDLGLILRAEVIWAKPNGLPESVTDRVRRSHEQWFHFTLEPRYFSAVDEIREPHKPGQHAAALSFNREGRGTAPGQSVAPHRVGREDQGLNALGKLPGSVWTIPTEPLKVPAELGVDHFAAFPTEWPRRIISGWSPTGICVECGEGRRPVVHKPSPDGHVAASVRDDQAAGAKTVGANSTLNKSGGPLVKWRAENPVQHLGYACACPEPTAPTRPAVVLDPFGGTGTTALVAKALGRHGISVDMSADYCRLAEWRTTDPGQLERVQNMQTYGVRKPTKTQIRAHQQALEPDQDSGPGCPEPAAGGEFPSVNPQR